MVTGSYPYTQQLLALDRCRPEVVRNLPKELTHICTPLILQTWREQQLHPAGHCRRVSGGLQLPIAEPPHLQEEPGVSFPISPGSLRLHTEGTSVRQGSSAASWHRAGYGNPLQPKWGNPKEKQTKQMAVNRGLILPGRS